MRQAADYFYSRKAHLSKKTVRSDTKHRSSKRGAYERAIKYFIDKNNIADLPPRLVKQKHFEAVISRDIATSTMHFYFSQLRMFWNKLLEWSVVEKDYLKAIKKIYRKRKQVPVLK